ncbi:MAG: sigma-70 family RNA polymerase sigma factor [Flavobacteriales bacterium]|nr:sigma-70 family RNA polymerase sigma factor [Flavobacteriales bacterium]
MLIDNCLKNNRKSQELIFRTFYNKMMSVCRRYTADDDQAKDIVQDGFIKVFKNLEKFNYQGSFEGWIRRIMVNTAIDFTRKKKSSQESASEQKPIEEYSDIAVEEDDEIPEEYALNVNDIQRGMSDLSNAYRNVFNLYVFENYSHQEIADELNISVGTSKSNLAKARSNLKKILLKELKKRDGK